MTADGVEPGNTPPDPVPAGGGFVPVHVGVYAAGIDELSIRDSSWRTIFFVGVRWTTPCSTCRSKRPSAT